MKSIIHRNIFLSCHHSKNNKRCLLSWKNIQEEKRNVFDRKTNPRFNEFVGEMMDASQIGQTYVIAIFEETSGWFLKK